MLILFFLALGLWGLESRLLYPWLEGFCSFFVVWALAFFGFCFVFFFFVKGGFWILWA